MANPPTTKPTNDCYSAGERTAMLRNQEWRGQVLRPLLKLLTHIRVSPDLITVASLLAGLAFAPAWFSSPLLAFGLLLLHVLLDGLDGPLARYQNVASRKGSFTDTMADQLVVFATTLTMIVAGEAHVVPASIYLFAYTIVVAFAMIRNSLDIPYSWLVRPRFIVYVWLVVNAYWLPGSLDWVLIAFDGLLSWKLLTGFYNLRKRLGD
ncbi:MAG: CDP-alcohol phosphatidyltransferase family protein [Planctomycetota bacterium]|nr:CDP-alcohol phosphatidyltransferase family protein [Planctomycetota bacterium]MDA1214908.1 CDP-alcohol phosphatidyltransferase family protein [Planctomycetota bacterium]